VGAAAVFTARIAPIPSPAWTKEQKPDRGYTFLTPTPASLNSTSVMPKCWL
jgi:hypothetical protein